MGNEVWSFIELDHAGRLNDISRKIATEAKRVSQLSRLTPTGVTISKSTSRVAEEIEKYGIQKLYSFSIPQEVDESPGNFAEAMKTALAHHAPNFIIFSSSATGTDVASRLAARLEAGLITNCIDFEKSPDGQLVARRKLYGGKANAICAWRTAPPHLATVDLESMEIIEQKSPSKCEVVQESVAIQGHPPELTGRFKVTRQQIDISESPIVIGIGRGIGDKSNLEIFEKLADLLDAPIGGSRMAVYAGLIPPDKQIGLSGKWIAPDVYIAVAISGASQHLIGIKAAKHVIALNSDKNAPMIGISEVGVVDDYRNVVQELVRTMYEKKVG